MKDRLTKKRLKVDYEAIIHMLDRDSDFICYIFTKCSKVSIRRQALAYLKHCKVNIEFCHYLHTKEGINTYAQLCAHAGNLNDIKEFCYYGV